LKRSNRFRRCSSRLELSSKLRELRRSRKQLPWNRKSLYSSSRKGSRSRKRPKRRYRMNQKLRK
jgi:hypothetical protein